MPHSVLPLLALLAGLGAYLAAPALPALIRRHPERHLIYRLSPLTLMSFILWIALIAWAVTGHRDDALMSRHVAKLRGSNRLPLAIILLVLVGMAGSAVTLLA